MNAQSWSDSTGRLRATISVITTVEMYHLNKWGELVHRVPLGASKTALVRLLRTHPGMFGRYVETSDVEGASFPLIPKDTKLPAEAIYEFPNAVNGYSQKEVYFYFGDNESTIKNISLGRFVLHCIPPAPKGPSRVSLKASVSVTHELSIAVVDPASMEYRNVGFVDFSRIEPPEVAPPLPDQSNVFDINNILGEFLGEDFTKEHKPRTGRDRTYNLTITPHEAQYGVQKQIQVSCFTTCPACGGSGRQPHIAPLNCVDCQGAGQRRQIRQTELGNRIWISACPTCDGTGQQAASRCVTCRGRTHIENKCALTISVPPGTASNAQICLLNQAEPGQYGGRSGHLYVVVAVADPAG